MAMRERPTVMRGCTHNRGRGTMTTTAIARTTNRASAMRKTARLAAGLGALGLALLPGTPAQALNIRSYLSSNGGGEACTHAPPCSSPQAEHDATEAGGEVHCLDAGPSLSIGHMLINKSITIDCHGGSIGAVVVDGGPITVKLRNVTVTFGDLIGIGVDFRNGAALFL